MSWPCFNGLFWSCQVGVKSFHEYHELAANGCFMEYVKYFERP